MPAASTLGITAEILRDEVATNDSLRAESERSPCAKELRLQGQISLHTRVWLGKKIRMPLHPNSLSNKSIATRDVPN